MLSKKPNHAFKIILGALVLTFTMASCNGSGDKKDSVTDTTSVMPTQPTVDTVPKIDTSKMDTATTRPVKTPD
jgi:hypothetical protein